MKKTAILVALAMLLVPMASFANDGAAIFKGKCQMCHGADGAKNAKADLGGAKVQGKSDADLVTFLTTHAAHKSKVADKAAAEAVVKHIRTLKK